MPMNLLEQLSSMALPMTFEDIDDIAKIQALRAAGLIEAQLPPVLLLANGSRYAGPATALRLTERGESVASQRRRPSVSRLPTMGLLPGSAEDQGAKTGRTTACPDSGA